MVRTRAGYALLAIALATSPIGLPFLFVLLVATVGRTALGPWLWDHLHIVYVGLSLACLVALAGACCLLRRRPLTSPVEAWTWGRPPQLLRPARPRGRASPRRPRDPVHHM